MTQALLACFCIASCMWLTPAEPDQSNHTGLMLLSIGSRGLGRLKRAPHNDNIQSANNTEREVLAGQRLKDAKCSIGVNLNDIKVGLRLGSQFLIQSQRPRGNFRYEYNWLSQAESEDDNPVRQAGTLWGLALLHVDDPSRGLLPAIRKGLKYFQIHSTEQSGGRRLIRYPGQSVQKLGAVALLALAHIEVLRRPEALSDDAEKKLLERHLRGYLRAIVASETRKHNFHKSYRASNGKSFGATSPYYDGESLLALVKAAKYLGHTHLWNSIHAIAEGGWRHNVKRGLSSKHGGALKRDAVKHLKGYYQWGSMAWYELLGVDDPAFAKYAERILLYGDWLMHYHANSHANLGYAYEGLIPTFVTAVRQGDDKRERKIACAIREGLRSLHSFQVGHPLATGLAAKPDATKLLADVRAQGGVQGAHGVPALRIDTTQHQMHSLLMALRLLQHEVLI